MPTSLKILYVLLICTIIFIFNNPYFTFGLLAVQLVLWLGNGIAFKHFRKFKKIRGFALALLFFFGFFSGLGNDFVLFRLFGWDCSLSLNGLLEGGHMVGKLLTMLMATFVVRLTTTPQQFVTGLTALKMPKDFARILDAILTYVEADDTPDQGKMQTGGGGQGMGGGGGKGRGMGGGRGGQGGGQGRRNGGGKNRAQSGGKKHKKQADFTVRQIVKGDFSIIAKMINKYLAEARQKFADNDIAVIAGVSLMITIIRFMKIAPGFPIAPGHKNVLIIPLFILATRLVHKHGFTATSIGFLSGIIHFVSGFGKYGPLGILQFVVLGFVIDVLVHLTRRSNALFVLGFIGMMAGLTRVFSEILLAYLLGMPVEYYLFYMPYILAQSLFGIASAPISKYLLNHIKQIPKYVEPSKGRSRETPS